MMLKKIKNKRFLKILFLFQGVLLLASCGTDNANKSDDYIKLVKTADVEKISTSIVKQYPGIIEEAEEVNLGFRVAGPIKKIYVQEGSYVSRGQLIAEMDNRDYVVQKKAIEAQVIQLRSEYKRIEELKNRKSVSQNDFEKMKAGKDMAEAKLKNAIDQLNDTRLVAPFSGYITSVMFEDGELINQGMPLVSMIDVSMLKVEINIPASMYIKKDNITSIECIQENIPNTTYPLQIYSNNIKANNNGLYSLYLYYKPDVQSKLAPGMNVQVKVTCNGSDSLLLSIPASAVYEINNDSFVWVVENNTVHSRKIKSNNMSNQGNIGIVSGLKAGEKVVIGGLHLLHEGDTVKEVAPASASNIGNIL